MPLKKDSENTSPRLFNFLYRDQDTLNSYYAQAFNGVITSVQQGKSKSTGKQHKTTPLGFASPLLKYSYERQNITSESDTESIDPHDSVTLDVLQWLEESGFIKHDISQITKTAFVKITGDLLFIDQKLLALTLSEGMKILQNSLFPVNIPNELTPYIDASLNVLKEMLLEPSVLLVSNDITLLGDIKAAYLSSPIANRYMISGGKFISSVTMIGLVSENIPYTAPEGSVLNGFTGLADQLSGLFSLHATHLIQPIVIYQEITP